MKHVITTILLAFGHVACSEPKPGTTKHVVERERLEGKAVVFADQHKGIQLSEVASKRLGLKDRPIQIFKVGTSTYRIPATSIVSFGSEYGILLRRENVYAFIEVRLRSAIGVTAIVKSKEINNIDHLVIEGVPLLRLAYLEAFGASGDGHGH